FTPFPQTNVHFPDEELVNKIIASIDPAIISKIKQHTFMEIKDLIAPRPKKIRNRHKIPRPQNPFVIFRRNAQAKMEADLESEIKESMLTLVSKAAGKDWKIADAEVKNVFNYLAKLAKKVHEKTYPNYVYKPRKKYNSPIPELQSSQKHLDISAESQCHSSFSDHVNSYHSILPLDENYGISPDSKDFPYSLLPSKDLPSIWSLVDSITANTLTSAILPYSPIPISSNSFEKNYEMNGILRKLFNLPCPYKNTLCSCSSSACICKSASVWKKNGVGFSASGKAWGEINIDTEVSGNSKGVEIKGLGFGVSLGKKNRNQKTVDISDEKMARIIIGPKRLYVYKTSFGNKKLKELQDLDNNSNIRE
ncbi:5044_t:CDS:2, partial [Scutellospora calospora]